MTKYFFTLLLISSLTGGKVSAQQVVPPLKREFLDSTFHVLPSAVGVRYRRETEYADSVGGEVRDYYLSGQLQSKAQFDHIRKEVLHGAFESYYVSGQQESYSEYSHGKQEGQLRYYYENGQLKRRETYAAGERLSGECYGSTGVLLPFFEYMQMPVYSEGDGSQQSIVVAVGRRVVYPRDAQREVREGQVLVSFLVTKLGQVADVRVVKSVWPSLDAAAVAAVRKLRRFKPGRQDGEVVTVSFTVPITFKLTDEPRALFEKRTQVELPAKP